MKTSPAKIAVAFALVIGAGCATALGAAIVFIANKLNKKLLAAALAGSTGVMLYVSFVEIFSVKAIGAFEEAGFSEDKATIYATVCFFGGMLITYLLDKFVHLILHGLERRKKKNQHLMQVCVSHMNEEGRGGCAKNHAEMPERNSDFIDSENDHDLVARAVVNLARKSQMHKNCTESSSTANESEESDVVLGERVMDVLQRPEGDPSLHDPRTGAPLASIRGHENELTREIRQEFQQAIHPQRAHPDLYLVRDSHHPDTRTHSHPDARSPKKDAVSSTTGHDHGSSAYVRTRGENNNITKGGETRGVGEPSSSGQRSPITTSTTPRQDGGSAGGGEPDHDLEDDHHAGLAKVGLLTAIALFIHNGPEGLATFIAAIADAKAGAALAFAVLLHNFPEGMCVSFPIYYATGSKWKGLTWGILSALSEPLGALVGLAIIESGLSQVAYGVLFGIVAGMMVFISLVEVYPSAIKFDPSQRVVMPCLVSGMAVIALSLLMFKV